MCEILQSIERGYARMGRSKEYESMYIAEENVECVESQILNKMKEIYKNNNLLESDNFYIIEELWRYLDIESYKSTVDGLLQDKDNVSKYLRRVADRAYSSSGNGFSFEKKKIGEFISIENAMEITLNLKGTQEFLKYPVRI